MVNELAEGETLRGAKFGLRTQDCSICNRDMSMAGDGVSDLHSAAWMPDGSLRRTGNRAAIDWLFPELPGSVRAGDQTDRTRLPAAARRRSFAHSLFADF